MGIIASMRPVCVVAGSRLFVGVVVRVGLFAFLTGMVVTVPFLMTQDAMAGRCLRRTSPKTAAASDATATAPSSVWR